MAVVCILIEIHGELKSLYLGAGASMVELVKRACNVKFQI